MFGNDKTKYAYFCDPVISLLGIYPTETSVYVHQNPDQNIYVSFIHKVQKSGNNQCPSTKDWDFFWNVHTIKSYIIKKQNKLLISSKLWLTLTDIVSERSLTKETHSCDSICREFKVRPNQSEKIKVKVVVTLGGGSDWTGHEGAF